jgi:hypothetical protein
VLVQLFVAQIIVTFLLSFVIPGKHPNTHPVLFAAVLGVCRWSLLLVGGPSFSGRGWLSGDTGRKGAVAPCRIPLGRLSIAVRQLAGT